jgi:ADP-ribose 1''-phosphate phosphatase
MVTHKKMSLFDAPRESVIIHACNSQGVWGSGIAKPFKEKYLQSFLDYKMFCESANMQRGTAVGLAGLSSFPESEAHWVGWIVTSHDYGPKKDGVEEIKINTTLALRDLLRKIYLAHPSDTYPQIDVYSNKFNSGLFAVPWKDSELILEILLKDYPRINWIVCDPDMVEA